MLSLRVPSRFPAIRLLMAAGLSLFLLGGLGAQTPESPGNIGLEVTEALSRAETARVVILLNLPAVPVGPIDRLKEEVSRVQDQALALLAPEDLRVYHRFQTIPSLAGEITAAGIEKLARHPGVLRVDLDVPSHAHLAQSVPLIRANQVQALGFRGEGITVAVLDTGVDTDHLDLADDIVGQECFCSVPCCPDGSSRQSGDGAAEDGNGHGTNVTGIVTSNGVISSVGVAPDAGVLAVKVLGDDGSGWLSDTTAALDWIYANAPAVKAVNMSLGGGLFTGNCDNAAGWTMAMSVAINNLRNRGTLSFASSGNDASGTQMSAPACIASAISVGAVYDANVGGLGWTVCTDYTTYADKVTCFSNSNSTTDVFAPGALIRSDGVGGGTSTYGGTSQASPHAAGCAADLLSAAPTLTPSEMEWALESSGVPVTDPKNGLTFPRIDCLGAMEKVACIDRDGDGYGQPGSPECPNGDAADCDDTRAAVYPGAPQICDGINNDCSDPSWPAVPPDEADADSDGSRVCAGDCDDGNATVYPGAPQICDGINNNCSDPSWPAVPADEADADGDGFRTCAGDCDDGSAAVYPGAPQVCDGVNNDCLAPGWPALAGTNDGDDDGDTFTECQADCDDADPATYSGAVETNDGRDNQCPSNPGYGIADEISGALAFGNPADPGEISWPAQTAATAYEAVRSTGPGFPPICAGQITQIPSWSDAEAPPQGGVFYYLVRSIAPYIGSWGQGSSGAERTGLCGAESSCADALDNDSDGQTDCDDPDCFQDPACAPATFTFTDTLGDDIAPEALSDFFSSITAAPTDYILFSISGPGATDFKWCAERADFYRDSYLALALSGGVAYSGSWNHWSLLEGGSWVGPDTTGYPNYYSVECVEAHAWCAEFGLAERFSAILPEQTEVCEVADFSLGCGPGDWVLTIQVGPDRLRTCGF